MSAQGQAREPWTAERSRLEREQIIGRARSMRAEIEQMRLDAEHWNRLHPGEVPIDWDPDGEMRRIDAGLKRFLDALPAEGLLPEGLLP